MRRSSSFGPEPGQEDERFLDRLRSALSGLLERARGEQPQQALPLSRYRGPTGPVVPYHERREQLMRLRRSRHGSYALAMLLVLLVFVVLVFYGLTWALGGLSFGQSPRSTATATPRPPAAETAVAPSPVAVLPTAAPGGIAPSPSPQAGASPAAGTMPAPGPGTPSAPPQRTYVVKAGDTPGQIARDFGVSVETLMRANNITDSRSLRVGQELIIPPPSTPTPTPTR